MKNFKVAILVETANEYSRGLMRGISRYILENGTWDIYYEERALDSPVPKWLASWRGDGIIVRSQTQDTTAAALATGAKVVDLSENRLPGLPTIYHDYAATARLAAEHLQERRYPNFGFVGIRGRKFSNARLVAFCNYFHGNVSVLELEPNELAESGISGHERLTEWLTQLPKPCGVMVCYDLVGIYVIQACRSAGIHVPEDIAVVGANNDEIQCWLSPVPLSSVALNTFQSGYEAAKLLNSLMLGYPPPETPTIVPVLHVVARKSTDSWAVGDALIREALQIIRRDAFKGLTVDQISNTLGIHRRQLERRFRTVTGRTIHDEIQRTQLTRANELLVGTDLSLASIANRVGFSSASYLAAVYKKVYNKTPRS